MLGIDMRAFTLAKYLKTDTRGTWPPKNSKIVHVLKYEYSDSTKLINPTTRAKQLNVGGAIVFNNLEHLKKQVFLWQMENTYEDRILRLIEDIIKLAIHDTDYYYIFKY